MSPQRRCVLAVVVGLVLAPSPSWAGREEASRFYEDAASLYHQNKLVDAVIQLKNALKEDTRLVSARVLLGQIYLQVGLAAEAEKELNQARQLGADPSLIAVPLARAYLGQRRYEDLLQRVTAEGLPSATAAEVRVQRGLARMELRDRDGAAQEFAQARALDPASVSARVAEGTLLVRFGELDAAESMAEEVVRLGPDDAGAWSLRASVRHVRRQLEDALADYGRSLAANPRHEDARLARAGVLLDLGRDAEAEADVRFLRDEFPRQPLAYYLSAVLQVRRGDIEGARQSLKETTARIDPMDPKALSRAPPLLLAAGLAHYDLGQFEQAATYLERYVAEAPRPEGARKVLGAALLALGRDNEAVAVLERAKANAPNDPRLLTLLGTAYMRTGRHASATQMLEQAAELSGGEAGVRTQLAFSRLAAGQQNAATAELASVFGSDATQTRAGVALILLHQRQKDYARAAKVAETVLQQEPRNLTVLNLLAQNQVRLGQRREARASFERALAIDPGFRPARLGLGRIDVIEGRTEEGRRRFLALLKEEPRRVDAMAEMARLEITSNRQEEGVRWLEKARGTDLNDLESRLALVEIYLGRQATGKAREVAGEAERIAPENLEVLAAVGLAQLAAGDPPVAIVTFRRMADLAGYDTRWLLRIAGYQVASGATEAAVWSLQKALASDPELVPGRVGLAETYLSQGRLDEAEQEAKYLRERHPNIAIGYRLAGDVLMRRGLARDAVGLYQAALAREPSTDTALRLYRAERDASGPESALAGLRHWSRTHPEDGTARHALAEAYLAAGDLATARQEYEAVLRVMPNDPRVLNNLAYILGQQGDPAAVELARRAVGAAPDDPAANDTLGWLLVRQGKADEALPYLRAAQTRNATDPEIRYHLAAALARLGRREEAKAELAQALKGSPAFEGSQDARALLESLK